MSKCNGCIYYTKMNTYTTSPSTTRDELVEKYGAYYTCSKPYLVTCPRESGCEETIKKELNILEMLRPHLINAGIGMFDNVEDNEIFHLKLTFSGKEYKQLEEWLKNE